MIFFRKYLYILLFILFITFLFFTTWSFINTPSSFPIGKNFTVSEGESLYNISQRLESNNYISSALLFRAWVSFLGKDRHIQLGVYSFDKAIPLGAVVKKLISANPDAPLLKVTIPEGSSTGDIANILKNIIPDFSPEVFIQKVNQKKLNGRLFPSTYYLLPSNNEDKIIEIMTETFDRKYKTAFNASFIKLPLKDENDLISLASILEGEAKNKEDMKVVSGIILHRLSISMPIQVDAAKITYTVKGLPEIPINNPGLIALDAAFYPIESPYLYYITDHNGIMHYSKTFAEHKKNIQKYLK